MVRQVGHKSEDFPLFKTEGEGVSHKIIQKGEDKERLLE